MRDSCPSSLTFALWPRPSRHWGHDLLLLGMVVITSSKTILIIHCVDNKQENVGINNTCSYTELLISVLQHYFYCDTDVFVIIVSHIFVSFTRTNSIHCALCISFNRSRIIRFIHHWVPNSLSYLHVNRPFTFTITHVLRSTRIKASGPAFEKTR